MMNAQLIVMRLADMTRVHPRQDNTRVCDQCGHMVGIYPSGQHILRADPTIPVICNRCHDPLGAFMVLAPGATEEPFESVRKNRDDG